MNPKIQRKKQFGNFHFESALRSQVKKPVPVQVKAPNLHSSRKHSLKYLFSASLGRMGPLTPSGFRSQANWEVLLSSEVQLSQRFETVARMIYGIGFTCVVVMGINKLTKDVCFSIQLTVYMQNVAVKVIMKSKLHTHEDLERASLELCLHRKLDHKNVIPFLGGEETSDSVIIVTPLAKGDLYSFSVNKVFSESNCRRLCRQLLEGLKYIHNLGLVHGDIKPHNIL